MNRFLIILKSQYVYIVCNILHVADEERE
jgi:hypothetical protein